MEILVYQQDRDYFRFLYKLNGNIMYAAVENYTGFRDLIIYSGAKRVEQDINLYEYKKELE